MAAALSEVEGLPRRERKKAELRGRILEAASALFEGRGFHATKVVDICERADVAQKTFFNHFPSKRSLLRELAQRGVEQLVVDIEAVRKAPLSTRERLLRFFGTVAEHTTAGGPMNRELVTELAHALSLSEQRSEQAQRLFDAFAAIVADGLESGDVTRRHDARTLTDMILGAYYVLMFHYANLESFPIETQAAAMARCLGDALAPHPEETPHGAT